MSLLDTFAAIAPVESLRHSRLISPECLEVLERLDARPVLRLQRSQAAHKGHATRKENSRHAG